MDLVDIIATKGFLGQDFLTWLWWRSDTCYPFEFGEDNVAVTFNGKATLESGEGGNLEKVSCSGNSEMLEARKALFLGKKIESAELIVVINDLQYSFTLVASLMEFKAVKLPKTSTATNDEEAEGLILERIYLFEKLQHAIEEIFAVFIRCRGSVMWLEEDRDIRLWICSS